MYYYTVATNTLTFSGLINGSATNADFYQGSYFYVDNNSENLRRVTLSSGGLVVSDQIFTVIGTGRESFGFGDVAFSTDGSAGVQQMYLVWGNSSVKEFATLDLVTNVYSVIASGLPNSTILNHLSQIAFFGSTLYNHNGVTGLFSSIDTSSGAFTVLLNGTRLLGDLASSVDSACPTSTSTSTGALTCGVTLYGVSRFNNGLQPAGRIIRLRYESSGWVETSLMDISSTIPPTSLFPNGVAIDSATNRLFISSQTGLFFVNVSNLAGGTTFSGSLMGQATNADFRNGVFYYINQDTDELHAVTFTSAGLVASETIVTNITGGTRIGNGFGDIVFGASANGTAASATSKLFVLWANATQKELGAWTATRGYEAILAGSPTSNPFSLMSQLAYADGKLFVHDSGNGGGGLYTANITANSVSLSLVYQSSTLLADLTATVSTCT